MEKTKMMKKGDKKKFEMRTPELVQKCMERTWKHTPTSAQIIRDIEAWVRAIQLIIDAGGAVVPSLDFRTGRRWGPTSKERSFHPDCQDAYDMRMARYEAMMKE